MITHGFIFARGGSKGLPGKNIKPLAGRPLIEYAIDVAKQVAALDSVFVSTDDKIIAGIAAKAGATIIDRPADLASDSAAEWHAWRHAIEWVRERHGHFDGFVSLPTTSPLRSVADVEAAMKKQAECGSDICIGITEAGRSPYFNMVKKSGIGFLELVCKPDSGIYRRQDAPEVFDITTVVYVTTADYILNNFGLFDGTVSSIEVPKERAVDIDDIYDFLLAEAIVLHQGNSC